MQTVMLDSASVQLDSEDAPEAEEFEGGSPLDHTTLTTRSVTVTHR